jgi:hypothetical protein
MTDTSFAASWLDSLLSAVDANTDSVTRRAIFRECSRSCTEYWAAEAARVRSSAEGATDPELLAAFSAALPGGVGPSLVEGAIQWRFTGDTCPCPVARLVSHPALCDCGVEHVRGMLEPLLGRPLDVHLLRSRRRGAEDCLFEAR